MQYAIKTRQEDKTYPPDATYTTLTDQRSYSDSKLSWTPFRVIDKEQSRSPNMIKLTPAMTTTVATPAPNGLIRTRTERRSRS